MSTKSAVPKAGDTQEKCAQYFEDCKREGRLPTVPGLALALGLEDKSQVEELAKGQGRACSIVRRALTQVEEANVQAAYKRDSGPSARFILQNGFGYSEKPEASPGGGTIRVKVTDE